MKRYRLRNLAVIGLLFSSLLLADEAPLAESSDPLSSGQMRAELGATLGFPVGVGLQIGIWNIAKSRFFARGALGCFVLGGTLEGEAGYLFDREGHVKQFVSLVAGNYDFIVPAIPIVFAEGKGFYVGPQYGLVIAKFFTVGLGLAYYSSESTGRAFLVLPTSGSESGIMPFGKIAFSVFL